MKPTSNQEHKDEVPPATAAEPKVSEKPQKRTRSTGKPNDPEDPEGPIPEQSEGKGTENHQANTDKKEDKKKPRARATKQKKSQEMVPKDAKSPQNGGEPKGPEAAEEPEDRSGAEKGQPSGSQSAPKGKSRAKAKAQSEKRHRLKQPQEKLASHEGGNENESKDDAKPEKPPLASQGLQRAMFEFLEEVKVRLSEENQGLSKREIHKLALEEPGSQLSIEPLFRVQSMSCVAVCFHTC